MEFLKNLYRGEKLKKSNSQLIAKLKRHKPVMGTNVIALSGNSRDQLDIFPAALFYQSERILNDIRVVGFAADEEDARNLVISILRETLEETGDCNIRTYLQEKELRG